MGPTMLAFGVFFATAVVFGLVWAAWPRVVLLSTEGSAFTRPAEPSPLTHALGRLALSGETGAAETTRRALVQAGWRQPAALPLYLASRTVAALGAAALPLLPTAAWPLGGRLAISLFAAAVGYYLPAAVLHAVRTGRQREIRTILPDALDMLVSALESGLGLDAALRYLAREITRVAPAFGAELELLNSEMHAGLGRAEALEHLDQRIGVDDIAALVGVLSQAERYGTGVADTVRIHARMSRRRRLLEAERRAGEAAPKLTVIMILFILPPLFVVLVGPTAVYVATEVIPTLEGR